MSKIKITVEEIREDVNGNEEVRSCEFVEDSGEMIENMTELFKAVLYWMTFTSGTIDAVIKDSETIRDEREARINSSLLGSCSCGACHCDQDEEDEDEYGN